MSVGLPRYQGGSSWIVSKWSWNGRVLFSANGWTTSSTWFARIAKTCVAGRSRPTSAPCCAAAPSPNSESFNESTTVVVAEPSFARGAGEPDPASKRECLGIILEAGANALEKVARQNTPDLTNEERLALECVLLLYGRPAVEVNHDRLANVPPFWNVLEDQREDIEMVQRGVGRIELFGHPEYDWAGTGFLVGETTLMTTRRTAEVFIENQNDRWQFRPGITAWMDYSSEYQNVASAGYRVRNVLGVHNTYDLALLEVEPPQFQPTGNPDAVGPIRRGRRADRGTSGLSDRLPDPGRPPQ